MADSVKKSKAPAIVKTPKVSAKPRKTTAKKATAVQQSRPGMPPREEIEKLARAYWEQRGYQDGFAEQDWLRAEQELLKMAS